MEQGINSKFAFNNGDQNHKSTCGTKGLDCIRAATQGFFDEHAPVGLISNTVRSKSGFVKGRDDLGQQGEPAVQADALLRWRVWQRARARDLF